MRRIIRLWSVSDVVLLIEHPSGVLYQNQVGGNACWEAELEGVLVPLDMNADSRDAIMNAEYPAARQGICSVTADTLDASLASTPDTKGVKVDRERLNESWEAWIHVLIESQSSIDSDATTGAFLGFGAVRGVLTWPNSD